MNFTFATVATLLLLLLAYTGTTEASCTGSDVPCQEASGDCTTVVRLALSGDLVAAGNAASYGKYCGNRNKCQVVDDEIVNSRNSSSDEEDHGEETVDQDNVCEIDDDRRLYGKKITKKSKQDSKKKSMRLFSTKKKGEEPCPAIPCDPH